MARTSRGQKILSPRYFLLMGLAPGPPPLPAVDRTVADNNIHGKEKGEWRQNKVDEYG